MQPSPARRPGRISRRQNKPPGPDLRVPAVYALWLLVAGMASAAGIAAPGPVGAGLLLLGVCATVSVDGIVASLRGRFPVPVRTFALLRGGLALAWASAYAVLAAAPPGLAVGMFLCAVLLAVPEGGARRFRWLALAACGAFATIALAPLHRDAGTAGILAALAWPAALGISLLMVGLSLHRLGAGTRLLAVQNAEMRERLKRAGREPVRDPMTRAYNRRHIMEVLTHEKARVDRTGEGFCVCLLDVGHGGAEDMGAGDGRLLTAFVRRIRGELRRMDTVNRSELKTRLGPHRGEEFILILPTTSLRGALRVAERVRRAVVRRPFEGIVEVTIAIGIAEYRPGEAVGSLLARADEALHSARRGGRNRVHAAAAGGGPSAIVMPDIPAAS